MAIESPRKVGQGKESRNKEFAVFRNHRATLRNPQLASHVLAQGSFHVPDRRRKGVKARTDGHKRREPAQLTATEAYLNKASFSATVPIFFSSQEPL